MANTTSTHYTDYLEKKSRLGNLIGQQLEVLKALSMSAWENDVSKLRERVNSDSFKVLVMGEFNRGKSTLINALLGQKVLPAYAIPTTAIINEVKWGDKQRAILRFLPTKDGTKPQSLEISVDQIGNYVVIKESKPGYFGGSEVVYDNPYEKVELYWPLDICRDGVEIIDSPGLNEDTQRQEITLEYLKTVDVVICVIACDFPVARSEMLIMETVKDAGHEYIFFVCNRINMIDVEEQPLVMDRCVRLLAPYTKEREKFIFFVDSRGALEGRLKHNIEQVNRSNLLSVENQLKSFLATEKGRVKLLRPATELKASIREARRTLPEREQLLHTDLDTIQERYQKAEKALAQLEARRHNLYTKLENFRQETRQHVSDSASHFYRDVADKIPTWVAGYEIQQGMKIYEVFSQAARERVVEETTAFLTNQIKTEYSNWQKTTFEPLLAGRLSSLAKELDEQTRQFANELDQIRIDLVTDIPISISEEAANQDKVTLMNRILGVAGGFLVGDISSMALGAAFGFNEMLKSLIPQIALAIVTTAIVGLNPVILIPVLLFGGGVQAFIRKNSINKKIRDAVGKEYAQKLRESHADLAGKIAATVDQKLKDIQTALGKGLGLELQNVRDQVDSIITLKQQKQGNVKQAIGELKAIQNKLDSTESDLDEFIAEIALGAKS